MSDQSILQIDTDEELARVMRQLKTLPQQLGAPNVLKNALNSTARKVRRQIIKDSKGRYALKEKKARQSESKILPASASTLVFVMGMKNLPDIARHLLDAEIESILSLGIEAHTGITVGVDIWVQELQKEYDCLYIAIGAHQDKKVGIPGEDSRNVMSAVEMLRSIGDDVMPDFTGKRVVVIGGGNVAMDVTRSSIRLGAEKVTCVYRRRIEDMTALPDEVTGAMAEGAEIAALMAPSHIEADENGNAAALWVQPQIIGEADKSGRPRPNKADLPEVRIPADIIVVAIGQGIEIQGFEQAGVPIKRGTFVAGLSGQVGDMDNVFAGGDCVTGPASAIRAIAAGKVAAANIDEHLGFQHEIKVELDIPAPRLNNRAPHGRINTTEREACERRCDFEDIECGLTEEGARTEASRCLRCDHFGYGIFKGGRIERW